MSITPQQVRKFRCRMQAYIANLHISTIEAEKEKHIRRCGPFKDSWQESDFEYHLRYYPLHPYSPPSGSYGSRMDWWPDGDFDWDQYEDYDPMYYTPKRAWQLGYFYFTRFDREQYEIEMMCSPKSRLPTKRSMYRKMLNEKHNTTGAQLEIHEVHDSMMGTFAFELSDDENSLEFKAQMLEFMLWVIDPQRMLILEAIFCLQALGVYQYVDASTLIDLYEFSLIHPNAVVCTGCRSCRWIFANPSAKNDEFIMCVNPHCPIRLQRRDKPMDCFIALPYDNFNYKMWKKYCGRYFTKDQEATYRMIRFDSPPPISSSFSINS